MFIYYNKIYLYSIKIYLKNINILLFIAILCIIKNSGGVGMKKIDLFKYHHSGKDNLNGKSHFHSFEFEILHVLSGNGVMMIKDKLYSLKPNMLFFISGDV